MYPVISVRSGRARASTVFIAVVPLICSLWPCEFYIAYLKPSLSREPMEWSLSSHLKDEAFSWERWAVVPFSAGLETLDLRFAVFVDKGSSLLAKLAKGELVQCSSLTLRRGPYILNSGWMEVPAEQFWNRNLLGPLFVAVASVFTARDSYRVTALHRWISLKTPASLYQLLGAWIM